MGHGRFCQGEKPLHRCLQKWKQAPWLAGERGQLVGVQAPQVSAAEQQAALGDQAAKGEKETRPRCRCSPFAYWCACPSLCFRRCSCSIHLHTGTGEGGSNLCDCLSHLTVDHLFLRDGARMKGVFFLLWRASLLGRTAAVI